jgi:hypothetical protein
MTSAWGPELVFLYNKELGQVPLCEKPEGFRAEKSRKSCQKKKKES